MSYDIKEKRIYFDWAATSPYSKNDFHTPFGNPSSQHKEGKAAKKAIEEARERCASILNVPPETLHFTSGGTESNSIALFSNLKRPGQGGVISSIAEHASIREAMETLEKMGRPTGKIEVDSQGRVTLETLENALEKSANTRFVAIMSVNNETGTVTDIASIGKYLRNKTGAPVHLHCDLVQAVGKIPVDIQNWEIDSASISAHKINGPKGIGLLYLRKPIEVFYSGGGQEKGIRGGTENVFGAIAIADCLEQCGGSWSEHYYSQAEKRMNYLINSLIKMDRCTIIPQERTAIDSLSLTANLNFSPYILQVAFKDIPGEVMIRALDDLGFAVSTGSACSSTSPERPVLAAMGIEERLRIESIRISQGYSTTDEDINLLVGAITEVLKFL
ncbi:MAG: cysteine desulfurase [Treponema sp.]|jgi:cysteine desulfurase|nr:cysteine desulfurase [Treponema sp.]